MYAAVTPRSAGAHVVRSSQSKRGSLPREPCDGREAARLEALDHAAAGLAGGAEDECGGVVVVFMRVQSTAPSDESLHSSIAQCHARASTMPRHGRRRRTARRSARARGLPAALEPEPAVVAAHRGRGAADARRGRARRRRGSCPTSARRACCCARGDVAIVRGPEPYTVADDPATRAAGRDPARPGLPARRRRRRPAG